MSLKIQKITVITGVKPLIYEIGVNGVTNITSYSKEYPDHSELLYTVNYEKHEKTTDIENCATVVDYENLKSK